jgi:hypothetical protein
MSEMDILGIVNGIMAAEGRSETRVKGGWFGIARSAPQM